MNFIIPLIAIKFRYFYLKISQGKSILLELAVLVSHAPGNLTF